MTTKTKSLTPFGIVTIVLLSMSNLQHLLWTLWLIAEQVKTGWGYGTNMEMLALLPIFMNILAIPAILAAVVYLFLHLWWTSRRGVWITGLALLGTLALQIGLIWLFLLY